MDQRSDPIPVVLHPEAHERLYRWWQRLRGLEDLSLCILSGPRGCGKTRLWQGVFRNVTCIDLVDRLQQARSVDAGGPKRKRPRKEAGQTALDGSESTTAPMGAALLDMIRPSEAFVGFASRRPLAVAGAQPVAELCVLDQAEENDDVLAALLSLATQGLEAVAHTEARQLRRGARDAVNQEAKLAKGRPATGKRRHSAMEGTDAEAEAEEREDLADAADLAVQRMQDTHYKYRWAERPVPEPAGRPRTPRSPVRPVLIVVDAEKLDGLIGSVRRDLAFELIRLDRVSEEQFTSVVRCQLHRCVASVTGLGPESAEDLDVWLSQVSVPGIFEACQGNLRAAYECLTLQVIELTRRLGGATHGPDALAGAAPQLGTETVSDPERTVGSGMLERLDPPGRTLLQVLWLNGHGMRPVGPESLKTLLAWLLRTKRLVAKESAVLPLALAVDRPESLAQLFARIESAHWTVVPSPHKTAPRLTVTPVPSEHLWMVVRRILAGQFSALHQVVRAMAGHDPFMLLGHLRAELRSQPSLNCREPRQIRVVPRVREGQLAVLPPGGGSREYKDIKDIKDIKDREPQGISVSSSGKEPALSSRQQRQQQVAQAYRLLGLGAAPSRHLEPPKGTQSPEILELPAKADPRSQPCATATVPLCLARGPAESAKALEASVVDRAHVSAAPDSKQPARTEDLADLDRFAQAVQGLAEAQRFLAATRSETGAPHRLLRRAAVQRMAEPFLAAAQRKWLQVRPEYSRRLAILGAAARSQVPQGPHGSHGRRDSLAPQTKGRNSKGMVQVGQADRRPHRTDPRAAAGAAVPAAQVPQQTRRVDWADCAQYTAWGSLADDVSQWLDDDLAQTFQGAPDPLAMARLANWKQRCLLPVTEGQELQRARDIRERLTFCAAVQSRSALRDMRGVLQQRFNTLNCSTALALAAASGRYRGEKRRAPDPESTAATGAPAATSTATATGAATGTTIHVSPAQGRGTRDAGPGPATVQGMATRGAGATTQRALPTGGPEKARTASQHLATMPSTTGPTGLQAPAKKTATTATAAKVAMVATAATAATATTAAKAATATTAATAATAAKAATATTAQTPGRVGSPQYRKETASAGAKDMLVPRSSVPRSAEKTGAGGSVPVIKATTTLYDWCEIRDGQCLRVLKRDRAQELITRHLAV